MAAQVRVAEQVGWRRRLGWPSRIRRWPYAARRTVARGTVDVDDRHGSTNLARHEAVARSILTGVALFTFELGSIQM